VSDAIGPVNRPDRTGMRGGPGTLTLRAAVPGDIPAMHRIRLAVRENRLSDPTRVTPADYVRYVEEAGVSWVAELDGRVAGFGIADRASRSLWALFVDPAFERRGAGRALLARLTDGLFESGTEPINLSTAPGTRAERLYLAAGWKKVGNLPTGEVWLSRALPDGG
jgi:GNAT superfamily N-acetyltransferase